MTQPTRRDTAPSLPERAARVLPAGGFGNFDPQVFIARGEGSRVWDGDGNEYVDFLIGSGPMVLGHCHPDVVRAVTGQLARGTTFFTNNPEGLQLAEAICAALPCAEQLRFLSTGGEADMYAMRLARAHTGRDKVLKFEGGYHGMCGEALMSLAPTRFPDYPEAVPDSAGIPESVRRGMVIAPFNDVDTTRRLLTGHAEELACVIVEPLQRIIPPRAGFLEMLREETARLGIVLIFDEVVTGFRLAWGGAQEHYGVVPDLCTLGKIIGGGLPLAAVAGRADIMAHFDRSRVGAAAFTYQVGTLSGNPLAAVAGLATLDVLREPGSYERLRERGATVMEALGNSLGEAGIDHQVVGDPVLFDVVFSAEPVVDYRSFMRGDAALLARFNRLLRARGILKPASKFYASLSLTQRDMEQTVEAIAYAARHLRE